MATERTSERLDPQQEATIREGVVERRALRDPERIRGVNRQEFTLRPGLAMSVENPREPGASMTIDEPEARGGNGTGAGPLAHFLAGAGACLLTQYRKIAIAEALDIRFSGSTIRGDSRRDVGGGFEHIAQEIHAEGTITPAQLAALAEEAEAFCYVHNTLRGAVKLTTVVHLNGAEAVRRVSEKAL
jgi:uncharacterized OsmC-like protein